jgi:hypothetical protein
MRETLRAVVLGLLIVLPLSALSETLHGKVTDANGAALQDSIILVQHWTLNALRHVEADTPIMLHPAPDGRYNVILAPGIYDLFVSCGFCAPQAKQVKVAPRATKSVDFGLKDSRYTKSTD